MYYLKRERPVQAYQMIDTGTDTVRIPSWILNGIINGTIQPIHPENPKKFRIKDSNSASWLIGNEGDWIVLDEKKQMTVVSAKEFENNYQVMPEAKQG